MIRHVSSMQKGGVALVGVGLGLWILAVISTPDQILISIPFGSPDSNAINTIVLIPVRGDYGLYLRFDGSPNELGLAAEKQYVWFEKEIYYPLRVQIRTNSGCLYCTNLQTLIKAKEGHDVVCYSLAYLTIDQRERITLGITDDSTNAMKKRIPARIELHRSPITTEN